MASTGGEDYIDAFGCTGLYECKLLVWCDEIIHVLIHRLFF